MGLHSPLEGSICLSLGCYPVDTVAALMNTPTTTEKQPFDVLIRQADVKSSWPSGARFRSALNDGSGKSYRIPPFSVGTQLPRPYLPMCWLVASSLLFSSRFLQTTDDDFIDISESAIPGTNTYTIEDNGQILSNWLFAVYVHTPTVAYFDAVQEMVDKEKRWVNSLTSFTTYSLRRANWDAPNDEFGPNK